MQERISPLRRAECHNAPHSAGRWNLDRIRREATGNAGADDDGSGQLLYQTSFGSKGPVAYETLLLDSMCGDATLFTRRDEVEAEWRIITPIEEAWAQVAELADLVARGELEVPIAGVFALDDVRDAHRELGLRHTRGKLVLRP